MPDFISHSHFQSKFNFICCVLWMRKSSWYCSYQHVSIFKVSRQTYTEVVQLLLFSSLLNSSLTSIFKLRQQQQQHHHRKSFVSTLRYKYDVLSFLLSLLSLSLMFYSMFFRKWISFIYLRFGCAVHTPYGKFVKQLVRLLYSHGYFCLCFFFYFH